MKRASLRAKSTAPAAKRAPLKRAHAKCAPELPHTGSMAALSRDERACLGRLAELVTRELGIRMPASKHTLLYGRLVRRLRALELPSLAAYEKHLEGHGAEEMRHFYDVVTTNKTEFFREPRHFEYLSDEALPALAALRAPDGRWNCRVWCAGCSSGQEVYTLAMVLSEYARERPGFTFEITATDISSRVLKQAATAVYDEADVKPVTMPLRKAYLLRSKDPGRPTVKVAPELRKRVKFARLNFMDERFPLEGPFDVIFFRNVMIYFDHATQEKVIQRQCRLLRTHGYFFISHTETLSGLHVPLHSVSSAVYRKLP